jgi:hypothetical protein
MNSIHERMVRRIDRFIEDKPLMGDNEKNEEVDKILEEYQTEVSSRADLVKIINLRIAQLKQKEKEAQNVE